MSQGDKMTDTIINLISRHGYDYMLLEIENILRQNDLPITADAVHSAVGELDLELQKKGLNMEQRQRQSNFETNSIRRKLLDDGARYKHWSIVALECFNNAKPGPPLSKMDQAKFDLADVLKEQFRDYTPEDMDTAYIALPPEDFDKVHWDSLAESLLDTITERGLINAKRQ